MIRQGAGVLVKTIRGRLGKVLIAESSLNPIMEQ
jgi:hypothetical protein